MKLRFYSKEAIGLWTLALSPCLGCILFSYNLKAIGKGYLVPYFVVVGVFWTMLMKRLLVPFVHIPLLQLIFSNLIGSLILTLLLWDRFFLQYPDYEKRPVWKPVLIFVNICVGLILLQFLLQKSKV
jgi:hypothetical protein